MTEKDKLADAVEKLEHTAAGILIEIKAMRVHGDSAGYFLQIACEDLLRAVNQMKAALQ